MSIFSRINDIANANLADLVERAENPAKMIKLAVMEMEEAIIDARAKAALVIADQKEMSRLVSQLDAVQADWQAKAKIAIDKGRDDLAKAALLESEKAKDRADKLMAEIALLDTSLADVESDIAKLNGKLEEARTRQASIQARMDTANARVRVREATDGRRTKSAMANFEVMEQRVDFAEARAEAMDVNRGSKTLSVELTDMALVARVDEKFAALKASLAAQG